jgi:hypothetical protein
LLRRAEISRQVSPRLVKTVKSRPSMRPIAFDRASLSRSRTVSMIRASG